MNKIEISIVTCSFNSKNYLNNFIKRFLSVLKKKKIKNFEIIIVDDYSNYETRKELHKLVKIYPMLKIIFLNKNLQLHKAMMIGAKNATGNFIYCTDIDLEVSENYFGKFYNQIKKTNSDIVYGIYKNSNTKSILEFIFKSMFLLYSKFFLKNKKLIYKSSTLIMTKKYVDLLLKIKSNSFTISTITDGLGKQSSLEVKRGYAENNYAKSSSYDISKRFSEAYEIISKLSNSFSVYIISLTLISIIVTLFYLAKNIYVRLSGEFLSGFTGIISVISLIGSIILIVLTFNVVLLIKIKNELENNFKLDDTIQKKFNFKNKNR